MKRTIAMVFLVVGTLPALTSAFAFDLARRGPDREDRQRVLLDSTPWALSCDNGVFYNAYRTHYDNPVGNTFDFGEGAMLSEVTFTHFSFGQGSLPGPYRYDIEIWDPASCTLLHEKKDLVAADATHGAVVETVPMCDERIFLTGRLVVAIQPKTCVAPYDCYPEVLYDDQLLVVCPVTIFLYGTSFFTPTTPQCVDLSRQSGPFLIRVTTNQCPTPARGSSWGQVKTIYR